MNKEQFLSAFFESLNKEDIFYFVYGSYKNLPTDTDGSDIDMVVAEHDLSKVEEILRLLLTDTGISLASYYENVNANAKFFRFLAIGWGVQIDILYKGFCFKGVEYYPLQLVKDGIICHRGIHVLDETIGFYVDYYKEILHNGIAKEKYRQAFLCLVTNDIEKYKQEIKALYGKAAMELIFSNLSIEGLITIESQLQKEMRHYCLKSNLLTWLKSNLLLPFRLLKKRPGYVVVVEGTDGSGKSTIIEHITPILNECFHNSIVYNHLRPNFIPDLGVLFCKKEKPLPGYVKTNPHNQNPSGFLGSVFRWGYYMIDYTCGYLVTVWPHIHTKSKVFIFDRYYYDYYIDQLRSRTSLPQWLLRFGELFIPKPDLILCLGGNPEKIYARKPETNLAEVRRQNQVLKDFCEHRSQAVWIDTTLPIEKSLEDAMTACYKVMSQRFYFL